MGFGGMVGAALGAALAVNLTLFVSALPAVAGKGAPYMPTLRKSLDVVFHKVLPKVKPVPKGAAADTAVPRMVDLGSGDGRVVIEAARNGYKAVGYELNPMLVAFSQTWAFWDQHLAHRILPKRKPWPVSASAEFYCRDLWKVNLNSADIILVYGLSPIMDRLSVKLLDECKDDVLIFSNVFTLNEASWRKVESTDEVHVYAKKQETAQAASSS